MRVRGGLFNQETLPPGLAMVAPGSWNPRNKPVMSIALPSIQRWIRPGSNRILEAPVQGAGNYFVYQIGLAIRITPCSLPGSNRGRTNY